MALRLARALPLYLLTTVLLIPVWGPQPQQPGLVERFDDPALPAWEHSPNAQVVDGVLRVEPPGFAFHPGRWTDLTLELSARFTSETTLGIGYSATDQGEYTLQVEATRVTLLRNGAELAHSDLEPVPPGEWMRLTVNVSGGQHEIRRGERVAITVTDPDPLPAGGLMLRAVGKGAGEFDDLMLTAETAAPAAEPTLAGPTPSASPTTGSPSGLPAYQAGSWFRLGGPPGGVGYDIRMRPDSPDTMFVTDASAGVFTSTDGGTTWIAVNQGMESSPGAGAPVFCATIDPHDPNVVWVGTQLTGHLYRSADGGHTWEQRDSGISNTSQDMRSLRGITIDPNDENVMYLGVEVTLTKTSSERQAGWKGGTAGEVYKSTDQGRTWTRIWYGPSLARYVWVDPRNSKRVYVSTGIFDRDAANRDLENHVIGGVGILRSDDGGQTWTVLDEQNGLGGRFIPSLFMHPEQPDVLLAAVTLSGVSAEEASSWNVPLAPGLYASYDGGDTWEIILPQCGPSMDAVEISTADPDVWYAATEDVICRSDDAGQSWQRFDMATPDRKSGMPIDLQADPRDPYRIFVNNYGGGNMVSSDGGQTWTDASHGYTGAHVGGLAVDPSQSGSVLAGVNTGSFYSRDGGQKWTSAASFRLESVAFLPRTETGTGDIVIGGDNRGRFYRSTDGGVTWEETDLPAGLPQEFMALRALAIAPSDAQTAYAGFTYYQCIRGDWRTCVTPGPGLFVSRDGGAAWQQITSIPFADVSILGVAVDPQDTLRVYVATAAGLFRSQDGGKTWQELTSLEASALQFPPADPDLYPANFLVFDVVADPFAPRTLYAAIAQAGVLRSTDGGDTWQQAAAGMDPNEPIYDLEPDPSRQGVLYASSWFAGVFVTTDGAQTWQRLGDGLPSIAMRELALSHDGSVLYAGTLAAGVWRLGTAAESLSQAAEMPTPTAVATTPASGAQGAEATLPAPAPPPDTALPASGIALGAVIALAVVAALAVAVAHRRGQRPRKG